MQLDGLEVDRIERIERISNTSPPLGILVRFEDQCILLFGFSLFVRADEPSFGVPMAALGAEIIALVVAGFSGWLGGELVDRLGIGVHPDAHPDFRPRRDRSESVPTGGMSRHFGRMAGPERT